MIKHLLKMISVAALVLGTSLLPVSAYETDVPENPINPDEPMIVMSDTLISDFCASGNGDYARELRGTVKVPYRIARTEYKFGSFGSNGWLSGYSVKVEYYDITGIGYDFALEGGYTDSYTSENTNATYCSVALNN